MKFILGIVLATVFFLEGTSQLTNKPIQAGFQAQKSIGMYTDGGFFVNVRVSDSLPISVELNYLSTRLGSALFSNALKQDSFLANCSYYFRDSKAIKPFAGFNIGLTRIDYGSELFSALPNKAFLLSPEGGVAYSVYKNIDVYVSSGINLFTSNGTGGIGSVMLLFCQMSIGYGFN